MSNNESMEEYLNDMIQSGYLSSNYTPIKCIKCSSTSYYDKVVDRVESIVMEEKRICNECGYAFGYWVTGNWEIY